jgi:dihydroorotase
MKMAAAFLVFQVCALAQADYDLLLRGGHVIDPKNHVSAVRDVAIKDGRIAAVAAKIDPASALKTVNVSGLYVTPGLIDIHTHVYAGTGERRSYAGDLSIYADGFTFRNGVTTIADAGSSGWRNFEDFHTGFDVHGFARGQHECRHEGHVERDGQVSGHGHVAR